MLLHFIRVRTARGHGVSHAQMHDGTKNSVVNSPLTALSDLSVFVTIVPGKVISHAWYHLITLLKTNVLRYCDVWFRQL